MNAPPPPSVDEATMDRMVQEASMPTLASLFQRAKDTGLIKPVPSYGDLTS